MPTLVAPLSVDPNNRRFVGPAGYQPAGTRVGTTDFAVMHTLLVAADGTTPLIVASNADAASNTQNQVPTSARLQTYNGTTWDRARGDTTNGLDVDVTRLSALVAGTAIVGKVGIDQTTPGTTNGVQVNSLPSGLFHVQSTVTLSAAGAYATGDYAGTSTTPQSFANAVRAAGGKSILRSITISDKQTTAAVAFELWLFSATFTAPTDSAAWTITDAEAATCVGVLPIATTNWYASGANKVYSEGNLNKVITCAGTSLFYAIVMRGAQTTWASGDLQISVGLEPE